MSIENHLNLQDILEKRKGLSENMEDGNSNNNQQIDPVMYNLLKTCCSLKPIKNCNGFSAKSIVGAWADTLKTYDSTIWVFYDEAVPLFLPD